MPASNLDAMPCMANACTAWPLHPAAQCPKLHASPPSRTCSPHGPFLRRRVVGGKAPPQPARRVRIFVGQELLTLTRTPSSRLVALARNTRHARSAFA